MAPRNPTAGEMDEFSRRYLALADDIIRDVRSAMRQGKPPVEAVEIAWERNRVPAKLEKWTTDGVLFAIGAGGLSITSGGSVAREFVLSHVWNDARMSLSQQLHKLDGDMRTVIVNELRDSMSLGQAWTKTGRRLRNLDLTRGDVSSTIEELAVLGKRSQAFTATEAAEYRRVLRRAQRQVDALAPGAAPTTYLKRSYQRVITAAEKGATKAIDKALVRAVKNKARYNAERVARTEIARAYGEGFITELHRDQDAIGYQSMLSADHPEVDVCDFHAEADLYGMGAGIYPKNQGPPYPYHPHCRCVLRTVYRGELRTGADFNPKAGSGYLRKQSAARRKKMLGVAGSKDFAQHPDNWAHDLKAYQGQEAKAPQIPPDIAR